MIHKFTLFLLTLFCPFANLLPNRRQQLCQLLENAWEDAPLSPYCEDLLDIWIQDGNLIDAVFGNVALFLIGLVLMLLMDILLAKSSSALWSGLLHMVGAFYTLIKFKTSERSRNILLLLFCLYWLFSGFRWSLAFALLVILANISAAYRRRL